MYMTDHMGAWQMGADPVGGPVQFKLFFPDHQQDQTQYIAKPGSTYGDPQIASIQVAGDFQKHLGPQNRDWDVATAPHLKPASHPSGHVWEYHTDVDLPAGFYEYKYVVTFKNGKLRWIGDPCTRYGGQTNQNSAFVIGGSAPHAARPIRGGRKHLRDLVVYELMIDDFTDEYRGFHAPLDAVRDRLDYLQKDVGINAILFMPWTAWPSTGFSWGYIPYQYFSVEYRYANRLGQPAEKLSRLKTLIDDCHDRGIHVIMDGVFNHVGDVNPAGDTADGFPYRWLYQDDRDSPYVGFFVNAFPGLVDLDYHNGCTQQFIRDVCFYWIDMFGIDGIRFDNTVNFYQDGESRGLPQLITDIQAHVNDQNFSLTLEHLEDSAARVTDSTNATSYWNNELYARTFDYLWNKRIDSRIMKALNAHKGLNNSRVATTYLGNHDHSHVAWQAGGRDNAGALAWYRVQPYAIALMTVPGSPMIHNGQEFSEDYWLMEDDHNTGRRVKPRPLRWDFTHDTLGKPMRELFNQLVKMRLSHDGLRSDDFYPADWAEWQTQFNPEGYGVDVNKGTVIYHRWGHTSAGVLQRFIVVLNFSSTDQTVDVPFPANGQWEDLLNAGWRIAVHDFWMRNFTVGSNWGHVFFQ